MSEIILSVFAVIGVTLLAMLLLDYLFYRKSNAGLVLIVDLRKRCEEEMIEILEMIGTVRSRRSGAAVIEELVVLTGKNNAFSKETVYRYLRSFNLKGTVYEEGEDHWKTKF